MPIRFHLRSRKIRDIEITNLVWTKTNICQCRWEMHDSGNIYRNVSDSDADLNAEMVFGRASAISLCLGTRGEIRLESD